MTPKTKVQEVVLAILFVMQIPMYFADQAKEKDRVNEGTAV